MLILLQIIKQHYIQQNAEVGPDMLIEFDSERVSLDIPTGGIATEDDTWKIIPLVFPPVVKLVYYIIKKIIIIMTLYYR